MRIPLFIVKAAVTIEASLALLAFDAALRFALHLPA
jgi:hypothetical protein